MRNSLAVQRLGLHISTAGGISSIPGQGTKILQAMSHNQEKVKYINKQGNIYNFCKEKCYEA